MVTKFFSSLLIIWNLPMMLLALILSPWILQDVKQVAEKLK
jgi:hypothetical protein